MDDSALNDSVAYLILAHEANDQLRHLLHVLLKDVRSRIYLHLDAKLLDIDWVGRLDQPRVIVLDSRVRVNWGGFSVARATIILLRRALMDVSNARFVLISGACFPLVAPEDLNNNIMLLKNPLVSVWGKINSNLLSSEGLGRYVVTKYFPLDIPLLNPKRRYMHPRLWRLFKWLNVKVPYERIVNLEDMWKGSQFFCIDRDLAILCAQPSSSLTAALRHALASDEILFTTIVVRGMRTRGSELPLSAQDDVRQGAHYVIKKVPLNRSLRERALGHVDLRRLAATDVEDALASGALFARKCSPEISKLIEARWKPAKER